MKVTLTGDIKEYFKELASKASPAHCRYMIRHIAGPIIHSEVAYNFKIGGRPRWLPLSPIYAKIKANSNIPQKANVQPAELGRYPTPFGKINVRAGWLFGTLGTIFRVTDSTLTYGTTAPHAMDVMKGGTVKRIHVEHDRTYSNKKIGDGGTIHISYYKDLKKAIKVPARPFDHVAVLAYNANTKGMADYIVTNSRRNKTILLNPTTQKLMSPGGRRVYIMRRG